MNKLFTRSTRLVTIDEVIREIAVLRNQEHTRGHEQRVADWLEKTREALRKIDAAPNWCVWNEQRPLSHLSLEQARQGLFMLRRRIEDGRAESIDADSEEKLKVATLMTTFGDYLIEHATENPSGVTWGILFAFEPIQNMELGPALSKIDKWAPSDVARLSKWEPSLQAIRNSLNGGLSLLSVERGLQWRVAWAIFTLGWQIIDSLGDALTLETLRCCSFEQARVTRKIFSEKTRVPCPHCGMVARSNLNDEYSGEGGFTSVFWNCESCYLAGYFPVHVHSESVWYSPPCTENHETRFITAQTSTHQQPLPSKTFKILFLGSAPSDQPLLALGAEVKEIMRHLRESEGGREFDLIQEWATRPTELQAILLRHKPNLVHFSGHGDASGKLIFEDSHGSACTVPVDAIGRLFSILGDGIQCVVLNACQSIAQARALSTHVPCVIGMNAAISDPAATAFSSSFYLALGHGHSVQRGFELGCLQIDLAGATAVDVPILFCKDGIDPNSLIFAAKTRQ